VPAGTVVNDTPVVVLLPGPDARVLGMSIRLRNERVAARAGARVVAAESLYEPLQTHAIVVPSDRLLDLSARRSISADLIDVSTRQARRRAAWEILRRSGKATDGWFSQHLNRPISRAVSYALLSLRLTANHASILVLLLGLGVALIAAQPGYAALVTVGVLFHLASVLDGVDGEMARATLTESALGARLDTIADQVTYVACFVGLTIGWFREGEGLNAVVWMSLITLALIFSLLRAGRFVSRYAPNASFVFVDRTVRRAARDSGRLPLRWAAAGFTLLRRDLFAIVFMLVALTGRRALVPALVAFGIVLANVTFTLYGRELADAAVAERRSM
jgi:phosphatidylglycerophosphate synthase